jgi:hypothetical protein
MGCLLVLFSLITPRFVLVVLWLFTNYLSRGYGSWFWPFLGFFFLPTTTIAYAIAQNAFSPKGSINATGVLFIVLGVAVDLGLVGGSARSRRR